MSGSANALASLPNGSGVARPGSKAHGHGRRLQAASPSAFTISISSDSIGGRSGVRRQRSTAYSRTR